MTWTRSPTAHGRPSPGGPTSDADLDDLAGDLVAHDPGRIDVLVAGLEDLDVGAAGRAVADPDLDLGRAGRRLRRVLDPEVARRVEPRDLHAWASVVIGAARGFSSARTVVDVGRRAERAPRCRRRRGSRRGPTARRRARRRWRRSGCTGRRSRRPSRRRRGTGGTRGPSGGRAPGTASVPWGIATPSPM